jgi:hypothetical protein
MQEREAAEAAAAAAEANQPATAAPETTDGGS